MPPLVAHAMCAVVKRKANYLRTLPPLREEVPPLDERTAPPPDERVDELLLDERTDELLLERVLEGLLERIVLEALLERLTDGTAEVERVVVVVRVAELLEERLVVEAGRAGVATELLERVAEDADALREGVVFLFDDVLRVEAARTEEFSTRVVVRRLLLPKVRDAFIVLPLEMRVEEVVPSLDARVVVVLRSAV